MGEAAVGRAGRARPEALVSVVLAGLLVLVTVGATIGLIRFAQQRYAGVLAAQKLRIEMYALSQLEWQVIARGELTPELASEVSARRDRFVAEVRQLGPHGMTPALVEPLSDAAEDYLSAYGEEIELLQRGDLAGAERVDEEWVDPAFDRLEAAATSLANNTQTAAQQANRAAVAVSAALVPLFALGVVLLLRREARRRGREQRTEAERASARRFEAMVRGGSDVILVADRDGTIRYASPAADRVLGVPADTLPGTPVTDLVHDADRAAVAHGVSDVLAAADATAAVEYRAQHGDGSWRSLEARLHNLIEDPAIAGLIWNVRDVTDRRALERQLVHQAFHDVLTGLANRALLEDRIGQAVARSGRERETTAVVIVDLDGFKDVNDSLGHTAGDEVIITIAARLSAAVRPGDTVARLGGDEFALLLERLPGPDEVLALVGRALVILTNPVPVGGRVLRLTASAGAAIATDGAPAGDLLRDADVAMYEAKKRGKNQVALFQESMRELVQDRLDLITGLRAAVGEGQIRVLYQPLVDLKNERVVGFEALARWHHPTRGVILPETFIPLAEDIGTILDIGWHVLGTACAQTAGWRRQLGADLELSVNLSGRQLAEDTLLTHVQAALDEGGLPPDRLVLEVTESAVVHDLAVASRRLRDLRALGVRIAMDDFGTGYSSLSYLRRLPIDFIKIDKSFLHDRAGKGPELLRGVTALGNILGLLTIAEGIEGLEQLQQVRLAGCGVAPVSRTPALRRGSPGRGVRVARCQAAGVPPSGRGVGPPP